MPTTTERLRCNGIGSRDIPPHYGEGLGQATEALGGLIFGLIHLRSSTFIDIQINTAIQVTDVSGIRRTIIQTPENRKVS